MAISVHRLTPAIGAEISGVDLGKPLSPDDERAILQAFLDHRVIFFRGQHLEPRKLLDFALRFGPLDSHPVNKTLDGELSGVQIIDNDGSGQLRHFFTDKWHSDVTFQPMPYKGALLQAHILPELGGDTLWSNLHAAYEALPDRVQHMIDGLEANHGWSLDSRVQAAQTEHYFGVKHPVVRVHPETGLKSLLVNEMWTRSIVGMSAVESQCLLTLLIDAIKAPETQVRFRWEVGSVAVWDNRCTAHYAALDYKTRRVMHRVTLAGEKPIAPHEWTGAVSKNRDVAA